MRAFVSPWRTRATARRVLARRAVARRTERAGGAPPSLVIVEHLQLLLEPGEPLAELGLLGFERVDDLLMRDNCASPLADVVGSVATASDRAVHI